MTLAASRLGVAAIGSQPTTLTPGGSRAGAGDQFGLAVLAFDAAAGADLDGTREDACLLAKPAEAGEPARTGDEVPVATMANLLQRAMSGGFSSQSSKDPAPVEPQLRMPGAPEDDTSIDRDAVPARPAAPRMGDDATQKQPALFIEPEHKARGFVMQQHELSALPLKTAAALAATSLTAVSENLLAPMTDVSGNWEPAPLSSAGLPQPESPDVPRQSQAKLLLVSEEDDSVISGEADLDAFGEAEATTDQHKAHAEQQNPLSAQPENATPIPNAGGVLPVAAPPFVTRSDDDERAASWSTATLGRVAPRDQWPSAPALERPAGSIAVTQRSPVSNSGSAALLAQPLERQEIPPHLAGAMPAVVAAPPLKSQTASGSSRLETGAAPTLPRQQSDAVVPSTHETESLESPSIAPMLPAAMRAPVPPAANVASTESTSIDQPASAWMMGSGRTSQDTTAPEPVSAGPAAAPPTVTLVNPAAQIIQKMADALVRPDGSAALAQSAPGGSRPPAAGEKVMALRIRLQPDSLGDVDVVLRRGPADVSVRIAVSSEAAAQLLQGDLRLLQDRLGLLLPGERLAELNITVRDHPPAVQGQAPAFTGSGSANASAGGFEQGQQRRSRAESSEPAVSSGRSGGNEEVDIVQRRYAGLIV